MRRHDIRRLDLLVGCLALALAVLWVGCGDDDAPASSDATDAGVSEDAGDTVWTPTRPDAGGAGSGNGGQSGTGGMNGTSTQCILLDEWLPEAHLPRCHAATATCIEACGADDDPCREACYGQDDMEPSPYDVGCELCVILRLLQCFENNGCDDAVNELWCCVEANCSQDDDDECTERECGDELSIVFTCGLGVSPGCLDITAGHVGACFADRDPPLDAGLPDDADAGSDAGVPGDAGQGTNDAAL